MNLQNYRRAFALFVGDLFSWAAALWIALFFRYQALPSAELLLAHLAPFGFLFCIWALVFFIADLYGRETLFERQKLASTIISAQLANSGLAVFFFYFIQAFEITPRTNLFLHLFFSLPLVLAWRLYLFDVVRGRKRELAVIIGEGKEIDELAGELSENTKHMIRISRIPSLPETISRLHDHPPHFVLANLRDDSVRRISPLLSELLFKGVRFIDAHEAYESVFGRVPLSLLDDNWFLENISGGKKRVYAFLKRGMDIALSFLGIIVTLPLYPFIYLAVKFDDGGELFTYQIRTGELERPLGLVKFRTMERNDEGRWGSAPNRVTRVGRALRKTRLDELPQLFNVLFGDISLIGPRPEFPGAAKIYEEAIPYYRLRHLIKPGLSGWAQIYGEHPHHGTDIAKTKDKLSYDLYYIKNKSIVLDITIALKTIKTLLSRGGV